MAEDTPEATASDQPELPLGHQEALAKIAKDQGKAKAAAVASVLKSQEPSPLPTAPAGSLTLESAIAMATPDPRHRGQ